MPTKDMLQDKLPPQSIESEEAVLGAIFTNPSSINKITDIINPNDFYKPSHRFIYDAMVSLLEKNAPIDVLTVSEYLKSNNKIDDVGGRQAINEIAINNPTSANIRYYANLVRECSVKRSLINAGSEIIELANSNHPTDVCINTSQQLIFDISQQKAISDLLPIKNKVLESLQIIEETCNHPGELLGVPTGFYDLDAITSGLRPSDLIILAARPSMGKTAFAINIAQNVAVKAKKPVAIFSLEMPYRQLMTRMIASEAEVDAGKLSRGHLQSQDWNKITQAAEVLLDAPIWIDDTSGLTVMDIRSRCRRLMMEVKDLSLIVIDYLQLMQGDYKFSGDRNQEISAISRGIKALAKELDVPIIALSQLSRATEQRGGSKVPMLSDLRDSGAIEQDADIVMFIHRPEYYDRENPELKGKAEVIIAKHRNGQVGPINLLFQDNITKFKNQNTTNIY